MSRSFAREAWGVKCRKAVAGSGMPGDDHRMTLTFAPKPAWPGELVGLRPVALADAAAFAAADEPEIARLTGTHAEFTLGQLEAWYGSPPPHHPRPRPAPL